MNSLGSYFLQPGYMYASHDNTLIKTVLGSCVSISVWDQRKKFGGMNHFIYPTSNGERSTKFGDVACPYLIKLMKDLGSNVNDLVVHVVGGASSPLIKTDIGKSNVQIAESILEKLGLHIGVWDVGGETGRKVVFNTATGECLSYSAMQGGQLL